MSKYIEQILYDKILTLMPIACVDVCIVSEKGALLVKRKTEPAKNQWWIPGGRVIKGEKLKDCAKRKCLEEVNLDCTIGPIVHTDETVFDTGPGGIPVHSINVCFIAIPHNNNLILDEFSSDFKWISSISPDLHPYVQKCLAGSGIN